jgi:hypothetical protein
MLTPASYYLLSHSRTCSDMISMLHQNLPALLSTQPDTDNRGFSRAAILRLGWGLFSRNASEYVLGRGKDKKSQRSILYQRRAQTTHTQMTLVVFRIHIFNLSSMYFMWIFYPRQKTAFRLSGHAHFCTFLTGPTSILANLPQIYVR